MLRNVHDMCHLIATQAAETTNHVLQEQVTAAL